MMTASGPSGPDLARIESALRDFDPALTFFSFPADDRLYDPDYTLYAVATSGPCVLSVYSRRQRVEAGDLVVIPAGLAIDVDPPGDFLVIRHAGAPPFHFRERFLQVWGFEHLTARGDTSEGVRFVLGREDPRHRLGYAVLRPEGRDAVELEAGIGPLVLVGLGDRVEVAVDAGGERASATMQRDAIAFVPAWGTVHATGRGELGVFGLKPEFDPRSEPQPKTISPEWHPT